MSAEPLTPADRERDRVAALREYGFLDEAPLIRFTELAAQVCGVPTAVINLVDDRYQHQLAAFGFDPVVCDRAEAMCDLALVDGGQLVVPDARADPRFRASRWVTGELGRIRFWAASPLRAPGGHLLGMLCAFDSEPRTLTGGQLDALATVALGVVDALELRRRGEQLCRTVAELSRSHGQLATFAAQLSHDLKTPLTASLGFGELLQDHPAVRQDPTALAYVDRSVSASHRMMAAIERLLGHASAGGPPQRATVWLPDLLDTVLADLGTAAAGAQVRCDRASVVADPEQLRVLLVDLVGNSVRRRRPDAACEVAVTVAATDWGSELRVTDDGPAIPAGQLGLATCERIVAAHGGTLSISDSAGGGTTVCVRLPSAASD